MIGVKHLPWGKFTPNHPNRAQVSQRKKKSCRYHSVVNCWNNLTQYPPLPCPKALVEPPTFVFGVHGTLAWPRPSKAWLQPTPTWMCVKWGLGWCQVGFGKCPAGLGIGQVHLTFFWPNLTVCPNELATQ